jgi:hypothetical protein
MKAYISGLLFENAVQYVDLAFRASSEGKVDDEVRSSLGAHVMAALVVEGAGNEVGETVFATGLWERIERIDPILKWFFVSAMAGPEAFASGKEPLQTVQDLHRIRSKIVHPKAMKLEDELIVRQGNGLIRRNASLNDKLAHGDTIFIGYGRLLDEFNAATPDK